MNEAYLNAAIAKAKETAAEFGDEFDIRLFISGVSKRASQLAQGYRYLLPRRPDEKPSFLDDALREVATGRVIIRPGAAAANEAEVKSASESMDIPMVD